MTNAEIQMTKHEIRMGSVAELVRSSFELRHSDFLRHLTFDIRHLSRGGPRYSATAFCTAAFIFSSPVRATTSGSCW
jgi:hypothetical protein